MTDAPSGEHDELVYAAAGLPKTTNWWGAFVIGLAGTILVTGIAPVMVTSLGAASIPLIVGVTITGYLLCLLLAELSAMMPARTCGGLSKCSRISSPAMVIATEIGSVPSISGLSNTSSKR